MSETGPPNSLYDLPRLLALRRVERELARDAPPALAALSSLPDAPASLGVLAGSFNPLTNGHVALVDAALKGGLDAVLLVLPLQAVNKETVTRAAPADRALVLLQWASARPGVGVAYVNRGLYADQATLLSHRYPTSALTFVVGHDKMEQIFDPRYYVDRHAALSGLFARAGFHVAPRLDQGESALQRLLKRAENRPFAPRVQALQLTTDVSALSSTVVRDRAARGLSYGDLVPTESALFVREALPYAPPMPLPRGEMVDPYGLRLALLDAAMDGHGPASSDDFARLCRVARADTAEGRDLRARLTRPIP